MKEEKEIEKCTFRPSIDKIDVKQTKFLDEVPGVDDYFRRIKASQDKQHELEQLINSIGTKYTGKPTDVIPFNLNESRKRDCVQRSFTADAKKLSHSKDFKKNKHTIVKKSIKTPIFTPVIGSREPQKYNKDIKDIKEENKQERPAQKCAKLKIHYAKDQYAEINVFPFSDPEELSKKFWERYKLAAKMKSQLFVVIKNKIKALKMRKKLNNNEANSDDENADDNDSGDEMDQDALKHYQQEVAEDISKISPENDKCK